MKQIKWRKKALRQLRKIKDVKTRSRISGAVGALVDFPNCQNTKRLVGHPSDYRLRVGNWRVLFTETLEIISIEEVKKRDERTY